MNDDSLPRPQHDPDASPQMAVDPTSDPSPAGDGTHPADAYHRAWRLLEQRQPRRAIALLDPAVAAQPESTGLRTLRAWAYFQSAQLGRAERELDRLVGENPADVWARYALGRSLERQSRYAEALPHLRLAAVMSGDPEHEASMLRAERRLAEVEGSYRDLLDRGPEA